MFLCIQGGCGHLSEHHGQEWYVAGGERPACFHEVPEAAQSGGTGDGWLILTSESTYTQKLWCNVL